ncbi:MAG: DEAD/DEAH box helicase [Gammaproteobacteria bacterium]
MSFKDIGLITELQRAVADAGYTEPTEVQAQSIPAILARRDLMVGAQTGTGKTAGFTLPMLQLLTQDGSKDQTHQVRALILTPTRELAAQVGESVKTYGKYLPLRSTIVFGGANMNKQIEILARGVDVLIATPGRLLDHLGRKTVDLSQVRFFVLDEADRMLDMGFINDIRRLLTVIPKQRQNLLFSATYNNAIKSLAHNLLNNPENIQVEAENSSADGITQFVHPVDHSSKRQLLVKILQENPTAQVLVFMNMKHSAARLAERIKKAGINATAIHGDRLQSQRIAALKGFKDGTVQVLVATDLASRGLDIEDLPFVINYDLPLEAEVYIHRIGRTGRAGKTGIAISLVASDEHPMLKNIEKLIGQTLPQQVVPGFEPDTRISRLHVPGQPLSQRA